jgi:hypothetical protein
MPGMNQYPRRGKAAITRNFVTMAATGSTAPSTDQACAEVLILGSATITADVPGGVTLTGACTLQLPCVAADAGQWWWIDLTAITYSGQTITVSGTKADGTATTGFSLTSGAIHCAYWTGSDMVKLV